MKMVRITVRWFSLFLILVIIGVAGCTQQTEKGAPLLPQGFESALIPDLDIEGYVYLNQTAPVIIPGDILQGLTTQISVDSGSVWLGPDIEAVGGVITFSNESEAQSVAGQLGKEQTLWALLRGQTLYLTTSAGAWAASLQDVVNRQVLVTLADRYPTVWEDFARFPSKPPAKPVAAGFLNLAGQLVESLSSADIIADVVPALKSANISHANFVLYGQKSIELSQGIQEDFLEKLGLGMLIVGRSGYPSLLLTFFFGGAMEGAGLTAEKLADLDVYTYKLNGVELVVARQGSLIYVAMAPAKTLAEQLILSAFGKTS